MGPSQIQFWLRKKNVFVCNSLCSALVKCLHVWHYEKKNHQNNDGRYEHGNDLYEHGNDKYENINRM